MFQSTNQIWGNSWKILSHPNVGWKLPLSFLSNISAGQSCLLVIQHHSC
jgi:hypothetical protein